MSTIQYINTGTSANKGDGDSLRLAFHKVNKNFEVLGTTTGFNTDAVKDTVSEMFTLGNSYGIDFNYNAVNHTMISSVSTATASTIGGIKVGSGISITADGTISAATAYTLPFATSLILGGVRVGDHLSVDAYGVLSNAGVTGFRANVSNQYRTGQVTLTSQDVQDALGYPPISSFREGQINGIATLDENGKVPLTQISEGVLGALNYVGTWNAQTNTPPIPTATGANKGSYYKVNVAGNTNIDGNYVWNIGDLLVSNGANWDKIDGTVTEVTSVAGRTGDVVLSYADIQGTFPGSSLFTATSTATSMALGVVKIGNGILAAGDGTIEVDPALLASTQPATTSTLGVIKVGAGLNVTVDGTLSAAIGSTGDVGLTGNEVQTTTPNTDLILRPTSGVTKFYTTLLHMGGNNNLVLRTNQFLNAGLATDTTGFSLRIVGDSGTGGATTLFDAGVYNSPIATTGWSSKFLVKKTGDTTIQGSLEVKGVAGIKFPDGSIQTKAAVITTATDTTVGGIKVGQGLQIQGDGTLSTVLGTSGGQITDKGPGTVATSTDPGSPGEVYYDGGYMYLCVATNSWIRIPITPSDVPGAW